VKIPLYDKQGRPRGEIDIPDEIADAAMRVYKFLTEHPEISSVCGLKKEN
jgi:Arc/MetJ family transcription regulator